MLYDRAEIKGPARITRDGYFVADVLVARANNIQEYFAYELGLTDREPRDVVRVFRPEAEVFAKDALASMAHRPITIRHPAEAVTAENWRKLGVGDIGDEVMRDGEFIRVPIKVMDAAAIKSIATDHQEFSLGYTVTLDATPGEHDGHAYDAVARELRYNHLAAVPAARGGPELRIVDERTYNPQDDDGNNPSARRETFNPSGGGAPTQDGGSQVATKTIIVDGIPVEATDASEAIIRKLEGQVADANTARTTAETQVATLTTDKTTLDARVTTLEKQIEDSKVTPAQLREAGKAYQAVVDKAKALAVDITDTMDEPAIMKAVVSAKIGDAAKDWNDVQIAASFATLTKDVKPAEGRDPVRDAIRDGAPTGDRAETDKAYTQMCDELANAWKPKQPA